MLLLVGSLCAAYVVIVFSLRRAVRGATREDPAGELPRLPADDLPPAAAVGRPPEGAGFTPYVDEGFAAIDAYLSQGLAP